MSSKLRLNTRTSLDNIDGFDNYQLGVSTQFPQEHSYRNWTFLVYRLSYSVLKENKKTKTKKTNKVQLATITEFFRKLGRYPTSKNEHIKKFNFLLQIIMVYIELMWVFRFGK